MSIQGEIDKAGEILKAKRDAVLTEYAVSLTSRGLSPRDEAFKELVAEYARQLETWRFEAMLSVQMRVAGVIALAQRRSRNAVVN